IQIFTELTSPLNLTRMYLNAASQDETANITLSFEEIRLRRLPLIVRSPLSDGKLWTTRRESHVIMAIGTLGCHERRGFASSTRLCRLPPARPVRGRKLDSTPFYFHGAFQLTASLARISYEGFQPGGQRWGVRYRRARARGINETIRNWNMVVFG
ncbi:hypothetical protein ALC62_07770, partial [Cyphomyrmex costatus]